MEPEAVAFPCADGVTLHGHVWQPETPLRGVVVINCATGVLARFYHAYARFLSENGFAALTYDYRGIGLSRPSSLRGLVASWRIWGEQDVDAALAFARTRAPDVPLLAVGHSIGGVLFGFAPNASRIDRLLTVGAQYAYWRDYAPEKRLSQLLRWHVAMPFLTMVCGYFPGRRLGWLEDLPAGVAREWAWKGRVLEAAYPAADQAEVRARFAAVQAPLLAVSMTDDPFGTLSAIRRAAKYYGGSDRQIAMIVPEILGFAQVGHFDLFRVKHKDGFWSGTLQWLRDGTVPWPTEKLDPDAA